MFGPLTTSSKIAVDLQMVRARVGGAATKATASALSASRTSTTEKPSLNMWPMKAWPFATMTWTPSERPPWSHPKGI